ncbi:MAG TPA: Ig-like domain-containing protein [Longimicrobiaceae bacterium]
MKPRLAKLTTLAAALLLAACEPGRPTGPAVFRPPATPPVVTLEKVSGDGQTVPVDQALPEPLVLRVLDASGRPAAGVAVRWGHTANGLVSPAESVTDGAGIASTRWTPRTPGPQSATATVASGSGQVTAAFHASAVGRPEKVVLNPAEGLRIQPGASSGLGAYVQDAYFAVVPARVTWSSSDTTVAQVDSLGRVTGRKPGSAVVTASTGEIRATAPVRVVRPLLATSVSAAGHACAVTPDRRAFCWGSNYAGQLGDGSTTSSAAPVPVAGGPAWTQVAAGFGFTCGLDAGGRAQCWGSNRNAELGTGSTDASPHPVPQPVAGGLAFRSVAAGGMAACGLTADGRAHCWGYFPLTDSATYRGTCVSSGWCTPAPRPVSDSLSFAQLSIGSSAICGVATAGRAYCWGANNRTGVLGNGTMEGSVVPRPVAGDLRFRYVATAADHTCGITVEGAAYCWGASRFGQAGTGAATSTYLLSPQPVAGGLSFASLALGTEHTCGLTTGGAVYCWGWNVYGQLGDGTRTTRDVPTRIAAEATFGSLSAGSDYACATATDGRVFCWGAGQPGSTGVRPEVSLCSEGKGWPMLDCTPRPTVVLGGEGP